ncbi:MAG: DsbA family protein [bacterium]|nr:DsbA family protein [bacterium]
MSYKRFKNQAIALGVIGMLFILTASIFIIRVFYFRDTHYRIGNVPPEMINELIPKDVPVSSLIPPAIRLYDPLRYGGATSVISIIEFGDYECEFCKAMHEIIANTLPIYHGTVRFVFRDLPIIDKHRNALDAAVFARCASQQGTFWPVYDALMLSSTLNERVYREIIQNSDLDKNEMANCRSNPQITASIQQDIQEARADGIKGVPLFFIGRTAYEGYLTEEELRDAIQSALSSL